MKLKTIISAAIISSLLCSVPVMAQDKIDYQTALTYYNEEEKISVMEIWKTNENTSELTSYLYVVGEDTGLEYLEIERKEKVKYITAISGLNVRSFPNVSYDNIITALPYAEKVNVLGECNGWSLIQYNEDKCFVWSEYLSKKKPKKLTVETVMQPLHNRLTKAKGVNYFNGYRETWYSQRVLPGGGLNIPGRYVDDYGLIRDKDGYICVASSDLSKGTVVKTSLGTGKVYDCGCASGTIDIYTNW